MRLYRSEKDNFVLQQWQIKVIEYDIPTDLFESDMVRRLLADPSKSAEWICEQKIEGCLRRMHLAWDPILTAEGITIPPGDEDYVNLVISQPTYEDRSQRMAHEVNLLKPENNE